MLLFQRGDELSGYLQEQRSAGRQIGFVPTMGALHEGHISLIGQSKATAPLTVCSIFINPTQFNDPKDFRKYPVTIEKDIYLLEKAGADSLFLPEVAEIYPGGMQGLETYALGPLETVLEGKYRPGHFQGVCQVMRRLLDRVQPDHLFMGQKDYQQCLVIRRLLELTGSAVLLHGCPIMREPDGLAMSSRNLRLTEDERKRAPAIHEALSWLKKNWPGGQGQQEALLEHARNMLVAQDFRIDYVEIANGEDLGPLRGEAESAGAAQNVAEVGAIALAAAFQGEIRLIDNIILS